jgi:DNA repair exonuclease SbcCD nuclease subunit
MAFTFLHTADWQIGKPYGGFEPEVQGVLRDARLSAIDRLAEAALRAGARHVLVAGDVFDADRLPGKVLRQPIEKLSGHARLNWHLLPGNHDPHRPGGLWEELVASKLPANVRALLSTAPVEIETGVFLLPAPLLARSSASDPSAAMDRAETPKGALRIGIAHGSVKGFGHEGEPATPIARERADHARLDYLALGDWHGAREAGPRAWYSGTPEPDRFLDNDAGHALIVRIAGSGKAPAIERVATARFLWRRLAVALSGGDPIAELEEALGKLPAASDRLLVALGIRGAVDAGAYAAIAAFLDSLEPRLRVLERDLDGLLLQAGGSGAEFSGSAELAAVAQWLEARARSPEPDAATATRALARLALLASSSRERVRP